MMTVDDLTYIRDKVTNAGGDPIDDLLEVVCDNEKHFMPNKYDIVFDDAATMLTFKALRPVSTFQPVTTTNRRKFIIIFVSYNEIQQVAYLEPKEIADNI